MGVNFMEVLIIFFYVYFPARGCIRNIIESFVLYLLLNITNVYDPTPPIENFQFQSAAPPPLRSKNWGENENRFYGFHGFREKAFHGESWRFCSLLLFSAPRAWRCRQPCKKYKVSRRLHLSTTSRIGGGNH